MTVCTILSGNPGLTALNMIKLVHMDINSW